MNFSRHPTLDTQLTKDRHKSEARSLLKCKQIGVSAPTMFLCDNVTNTIVMENISTGVTAKQYIDTRLGQEESRQELVSLAKMIGHTVAKMHSAGWLQFCRLTICLNYSSFRPYSW